MIGKPENLDKAAPELRRVDHFASASEYIAFLKPSADSCKTDSYTTGFSGTASYAEADKLAREGWPEGRDKASKLSGGQVADIGSRIQRMDWAHDVEGSIIDVALYLDGEPECFMRPEIVETEIGSHQQHVKIVFNHSVSGSVSNDVIEQRGAAFAALAELLELAGKQVTVILACGAGNLPAGKSATYYVTIKGPSERVDLSSLMYWLAHPSALRRHGFAYLETLGAGYQVPGYGRPIDPSINLDGHGDTDVYVSSALHGPDCPSTWGNPTAVAEWITKTLGELGVTFTGQ